MDADPFACAVVQMLNDLFSRFDLLVEQYDLNKVKTIGDCYMVVRRNLHISFCTILLISVIGFVTILTDFNPKL